MAGIRIIDLPTDTVINNNDVFLTSTVDGNARTISGQTLINRLSGITSASNNGTGVNVYNTSRSTGTNLVFNNISTITPLSASYSPNGAVLLSIPNRSITSQQLSDGAVGSGQIADNAIGSLDVGYEGAVLQTIMKQSALRVNIKSKNWTDTGFYASIKPKRVNSKILIRCNLLLGSDNEYPYVTIHRYDNNVFSKDLTITDSQGWTGTDYYNSWSLTPVTIEVYDEGVWDITHTYTYRLVANNSIGTTFIGASDIWYRRNDTGVMQPTTMILTEIHGSNP
jgi:hypothetical protein